MQNQDQSEQYTTLQIPAEVHRDWKVFVAMRGGKIRDYTVAALIEHMRRQSGGDDQAA